MAVFNTSPQRSSSLFSGHIIKKVSLHSQIYFSELQLDIQFEITGINQNSRTKKTHHIINLSIKIDL